MTALRILLIVFATFAVVACAGGPYDWMGRDAFDNVMDKYSSINGKNCKGKTRDELVLPKATVSMVPRSNQLLDVRTRVFQNRTCLLAMHNLALGRSYFYSLLFKLTNRTDNFWKQPGWEYEYFRQVGFINGHYGCLNRTGLYYDYKLHYPNWLSKVPVNHTIEFYAPITFRYDDVRTAFMRENSNKGVRSWDIGVGSGRNYTDKAYTTNLWYRAWLPDGMKEKGNRKGSYTVGIKYSDTPGKWRDGVYKGHAFFGPPLTRLQDDINVPVQFTQPYFDCGKRNKWIVSAVSPIVDSLPRYRRDEEVREFGESIET